MSYTEKPKIFISYSHEDEEWKDYIKLKLTALNYFDIWHDRNLRLGEEWFEKIKEETYKTDIVVMLVSDNFLTSGFISNEEIPVFVERAKKESIMLVPLIVSHCQWEEYNWLSSRQGYPIDNKPLDSFQVQHHVAFNKCPKINRQATLLAKRIKQEYLDDNKKVITEKEDDLSKIVSFLIKSKITPQTLKSTAKQYLQSIYQRELESKTTLKDIIDYLDNHDKNPLFCVIKELFKDDEFIKQWLEQNYHIECPKVVIDDWEYEDRIVVDFEPASGKKKNNKYNIYINYYFKGKFKASQEPTFKNLVLKDDDSIQEFKKELLNILYDEIAFYEHIDFILPKKLLLLDIKLWSIEDKVNYIKKCFMENIKINFHLRERLDFRDKVWSSCEGSLNKKVSETFSTMQHPSDKCTDSSKIGLKYFFIPAKDQYEVFFDRVKLKPIAIRCTREEDIEKYKNWLNTKNNIQVKNLKNEIDKEECKCISLIWDNPTIPLKPTKGIKP